LLSCSAILEVYRRKLTFIGKAGAGGAWPPPLWAGHCPGGADSFGVFPFLFPSEAVLRKRWISIVYMLV
jgi:hypothetical protein